VFVRVGDLGVEGSVGGMLDGVGGVVDGHFGWHLKARQKFN